MTCGIGGAAGTWAGTGGADGGAASRVNSWLAVGVVSCGVMFWGPSSSSDDSSSSKASS